MDLYSDWSCFGDRFYSCGGKSPHFSLHPCCGQEGHCEPTLCPGAACFLEPHQQVWWKMFSLPASRDVSISLGPVSLLS